MSYNPSAPGVKGAIFGLPYTEEEASIIILPVPWDVTASYHCGTAKAPQSILDASVQLDLEIFGVENAWKTPIWMAPISDDILKINKELRTSVEPYLDSLETESKSDQDYSQAINNVNEASLRLKNKIKNQAIGYLDQNKVIGVLGGEHSVPLGLMEALAEKHDDYGILQIDAHMDLRNAYEEFEQSHASIMYHAIQIPQVNKLVQVGIRDYCPEEVQYVNTSDGKVEVFYDFSLKSQMYNGETWDGLCEKIINPLPQNVYISFDIDGLTPHLCTGAGTPVSGGLEFQEAIYLIEKVVKSGRKIIGFDLCEVAPLLNDNDWNANVGARILYHLSCFANLSNGKPIGRLL